MSKYDELESERTHDDLYASRTSAGFQQDAHSNRQMTMNPGK